MAASQPTSYIIEPFDPERHDRAAFSCGVEQVDNYFQKTANKLAKADNVRLYVMIDPAGTVIGSMLSMRTLFTLRIYLQSSREHVRRTATSRPHTSQ